MSLATASVIASLGANFALIVSVIFAALQLRAATKAQRAQSAWQSEGVWARFSFDQAANRETAELFALIHAKTIDPNLDSLTLRQAKHMARGILQTAQSDFFLFREGSLPSMNWVQERRWLAMFVNLPFVDAFLPEMSGVDVSLTPAFLAEIADLRLGQSNAVQAG